MFRKKFLYHSPAGDDLTQISVPALKRNVRHESLGSLSNIIPKLDDKKMVICNVTRCLILQFYFFFILKNPATSAVVVQFPNISAAWIASFQKDAVRCICTVLSYRDGKCLADVFPPECPFSICALAPHPNWLNDCCAAGHKVSNKTAIYQNMPVCRN